MKIRIALLSCLVLLGGCGFNFSDMLSVFNFSRDDTLIPAASEARRARALMEQGKYEEARQELTAIVSSAEDSAVVAGATLDIARTYEMEENWVDAEMEYRQFLQRYPDHPAADRALYRLAAVLQEQVISIDRDISTAREALQLGERFEREFPGSSYAQQMAQVRDTARDTIAAHEYYIIDYYLRTGRYEPARERLRLVLDAYARFAQRDEFAELQQRIAQLKSSGELAEENE